MVEAGLSARSSPTATTGRAVWVSIPKIPTLLSGMPDCASASATGAGRRGLTTEVVAWMPRQQHQPSRALKSTSARQTIDSFERAVHQEIHFGFINNIRRHEVNRVTDRPQQQFAVKRGAIKLAAECGIFGIDFERPDHTGHAEVFDARMPRDGLRDFRQISGFGAIAFDHAIALEQVERS